VAVVTGGYSETTSTGSPRPSDPCKFTGFFHASVPGAYHQVQDLAYARKVATAYFKRYAPEAWERGDVFTLARIHSGGPKGPTRAATLPHARKVLAYTRR
jgi:hypothetical protein